VVSHPDRPQSNNAHLTVLEYYNMHADITLVGGVGDVSGDFSHCVYQTKNMN